MFNHGGTNRAYRLIWNRAKGRWTVAPERARGRGMAVTAVSALALLAPFGAAQAADPGALPSGGQVASGQITIGTSGNAMVIDQATARGIVNWQSFDVGSDASVTFRQPDAASVTLNRVTGGNGSTIAGTVNANGKVYIINPNGVLFSKGARVDVGGLVASTAGISDQDFLAGTDRFVSDGATGLVVNEGEITARDGGAVVLIGGTVVSNKGSIRADGGDAVLAAGATMLLDAGANGHLKIEVDGATTATLVENGGLIAADGGRILLRAEAANAAISSVVSNTGTLEANTMGTETGRILLLADMEGGQVKAGGSMTAAAPNGGDGGFIETSAATVTLADDLEVSTLAVDGGKSGEWLIDPYDVVITNTTQNGISENTSGNPFVLTPTGTGATIDSSKISTYLNSTSVTISTVGAGSEAGNITVNSAVSWNQANTLTLKADATTGGIIFNADINGSNGSSGLVLEAGAGGITQAGGTAITVGTIKATVSNGGSVDLSNTTNSISNLAASTAAGSFALTSNKALTLAGALTTNGAATLRATSGYITIDAPLVDNNANADIKLLAAAGININQDISLTGANAKLALNYNTILNYELRNGARLSVTGSAAGLTINGLAYTLVRNLTELQAVTSSNGNYALMADIDAAPTAGWNGGQGFAPINGFSNIFAGMGHTINGLTINRPGEATVGLFGLMSGTIRDLTVANVNVTGFGTVGGLVARLSGSSAALINTHVTGRVSSTGGLIGGLVGWSDQGNIVLSSSTAAVSGGSEVGGLVGRNRAANIANAYATGAVTGTGTGIGGLIGTTVQGSDVQTSYASGKVTGPGAGIGGLIGAVDATAITVTNSYWDIDTTGQTVSASGGTGISTANARTQATYAGFDFTNYWTMIAGQTRPVLRNEYAKVIYTPTSLQLARLNLAASYRLGADIDLTSAFTADASGNYASIWGAGGFVSLGDNSTPFTGTFNGQDHKITGLTVNRTGSNYIGLFGYTNGATVSNINLSGGSVSANSSVGALIGYMLGGALTGSTASTTVNSTSAGESNAGGLVGTNAGGAISGSSASGAVTGDGYQVGGLVGYLASGGSITRSYATGNVTGTNSSNGYVGGLVGGNGYTGNDGGSISLSYATGNVTGAGGPVGGLVGHNEGSITNAYATGSVTGTGTATNIGGLVGVNFINGTITSAYSTGRVTGSTSFGGFLGYNNAVGSAITSSYWDTQTSGQSLGQGGGAAGSITGRTTAQLQGSLPVGFSSTNWGTGTNLYPYFTWNYATTPVAISGIVRNQTGVSALQNVTITALSNGVTLGSAITGDNGYYYILAPGGSLAASGTIAYINDNATDGASFSDSAGVNGVQGLDINGSVIRLTTAGSTLTGLQTNYLAALGSYTDGDINFLSRTGFDALTTGSFDVRLTATGSGGMMLDTNLTSGGGMVLDSTAALAINADRTLTASGGVMTINAPLAWNGAHSLNLVTANKNIALNNNITATGGTLTLSGDISTSSSMIEVNRFQLKAGTWQQVDAARPVFKISDLVLDAGTSFLRAASGAGSTISPYLIYDVAGLQGLGSAGLLTSQFKLANDIDASGAGTWNGGAGFQPIGTNASPFSGGLNGNSFSITGLIINRPAQDNIGLFGVLAAGGSLNDIRLINTNIIGRTHVGGAAGTNSGTIAGVAVTGSVTGRGTVTGGLIGDNMGSVTESFSTATVVGDGDMVGGLLGRNQGGSAAVTNAYSSGTVTGAADNVGGLIGWNEGAVSQTYASGTVSGGGTNIGGLLGNQVSGLLTNNFWALAGTGQSTGIGSTPSSPDVTGLTAADMTKASSYTTAGWTVATNGGSASPWRIYDGNTAPLLRRFMTALSITGGTASKSYDGSANNSGVGTLTYSVTLYDATQVLGTASYIANSANAGTYNAANLALVGLYSTQFGYDIQAIGGTLTIDRTALTVAVNNATKTYDSLAYSGGNGVTYTGFVNGETAAVLGGTLAYGGTAQGAINAGSYSLTASGLTAGNYTLTYNPGTLTIDRAALTVAVNNATKTYDGLAYSGGNGVTYTGFVNGETAAILGGTLAYGGTAQGATNAGSYSLTASGLTAGNYTLTYNPGTLTIDRAALTVAVNNATKTYDGLAYSGGNGVTYTGFVNGETAAVLGGTLAYGGTAQGATNAGSYSLTASGLTAGNYTLTYNPGTLTIDRAALTVAVNNATKTYDGLAYSGGNGVTYTGFVNGETAAILGGTLAYGGTAQGATNAGSYSLTASGLTSGNYTLTYNPGTLTIDRAALTVAVNNATKTYDGLAYSGGNGVTYTGFVNGETAAILGGTLAYGGTAQGATNAGSYSLTASGLTAGNYTLTYNPGTLTIDRAALTVAVNNATKTYDGLAYSGGNGVTYTGFVNGETAAILGGTLAYGGTAQGATNAGSYSLTASGLTAGNYTLTYNPGTLTIDRAALSVAVNNATKTYDGLAYSGGNGVTYTGFVNGETAAILGGTLAYGGTAQGATNAGSYSLTASGLTAGNYTLTYNPGTLTIDRAALTVAVNNATKTYDGLAYSGGNGVTYTGFVNGETAAILGGTLAYGGTAQGATNAGSYSLTASGLTAGNYTLTYNPGTLTIDRAALTVAVNNATKTYDGLAYSGGNGVTYTGFVNSETAAILGGTLAYGGTAQGATNAGSYSLTASGLTAGNYTLTYNPGTLTIDRAALTVAVNNATKTYDGLAYSGGNGVTYTGFVNGETAAILGGTLAYGGTAQGAINAGSYSLTASGLTAGNYTLTYNPGTLTIDRAALTVAVNNAAKTYDGLAYSGGNGVTYTGFVNGETAAILGGTLTYGGTAQGATNAGSYSLTASGLTAGNYTLTYNPGTLTIDRAALSVAVNNATKTYDGLAYSGGNGVTYTGFVNGETATVLGGTLTYGGTAQGAINAGSYSLTASGLTAGNYTLTYNPGTLTIDRAALSVAVNNATKTYDGLAYSGGNGVTYTGFVNGETAAILGGTLTYGGTAQGAINAGSYSLTASGLTAGNYTLTYNPGTLTIDRAALSVAVNNATKTYDGLAYSGGNGVTYTGFVNGETAAILGGTLAYGGTAQGATNAGSYSLTASGLTAGNYTLTYNPGTLTIDRAALSVAVNNATKTYDGLAYSGGNGVTYTGFVNGETAAILGGTLAYGGTAQGATNAGSYSLTASGLSTSNYTITYQSGLLIVEPAAPVPLPPIIDNNGGSIEREVTDGDLLVLLSDNIRIAPPPSSNMVGIVARYLSVTPDHIRLPANAPREEP